MKKIDQNFFTWKQILGQKTTYIRKYCLVKSMPDYPQLYLIMHTRDSILHIQQHISVVKSLSKISAWKKPLSMHNQGSRDFSKLNSRSSRWKIPNFQVYNSKGTVKFHVDFTWALQNGNLWSMLCNFPKSTTLIKMLAK